METVALLQEALVNSLMLNGPLGTTLGLDADDGDEESGGDDDDDGSDGEALDTTLVRRGAELSGIARSAYSPLKELEEELPNLEEEELTNSVAPPVGETKTMTQRLHERILSGGPPLPNMDERILSGGPPNTVPHVQYGATQYGATQYGAAQYGAARYGAAQQAAESRAAAAERRPHANEVAEGAVMGGGAEAEGAVMGAGTEAAAKAKAEAAEAEAARVEALETARAALARSEQLEAEVPMPASNGL
jgi:hypothetical protein